MDGKELRVVFGKNVKLYRSRRSWSQADLAEYANISINFLGDIERGKKWPHPDTLSKIADALEIKIFELFMEENTGINPETQTIMNRFVKDVSLTINKSLSQSVNQSIENIIKQYGLNKKSKKK
ncbi:MAG: helix-turn-helix domain-containing protein [Treponema sp.]|nr:helix-turn-helix domain-containing protein [Treponema sp.]